MRIIHYYNAKGYFREHFSIVTWDASDKKKKDSHRKSKSHVPLPPNFNPDIVKIISVVNFKQVLLCIKTWGNHQKIHNKSSENSALETQQAYIYFIKGGIEA